MPYSFQKYFSRFSLVAVGLMALFGCSTNIFYEYQTAVVDVLQGELDVTLKARGEKYDEDSGSTVRGAPYYLVFRYKRDAQIPFSRIDVVDITVTGEESGAEFRMDKISSNIIKELSVDSSSTSVIMTTTGVLIPETNALLYEPVKVRATIRVFDGKAEFSTENININIDKDLRKEKRNKTVDNILSV